MPELPHERAMFDLATLKCIEEMVELLNDGTTLEEIRYVIDIMKDGSPERLVYEHAYKGLTCVPLGKFMLWFRDKQAKINEKFGCTSIKDAVAQCMSKSGDIVEVALYVYNEIRVRPSTQRTVAVDDSVVREVDTRYASGSTYGGDDSQDQGHSG